MTEFVSKILNRTSFKLPQIIPSLTRWVLGEEGEQYSLPGIEGYDSYTQTERALGIERLSHLGLFGRHTIPSCFATNGEPFYFLESKIEADGLIFPALHFAVKPTTVFNRENNFVFLSKLACDKITIEVSKKIEKPSISFVFNLTAIIEREKESRQIMDIILREDGNEEEIFKTLSMDGEFTVDRKSVLSRLANLMSSPNEYAKDNFVNSAHIKMPHAIFEGEPAIKTLRHHFSKVKIDTGREDRSRKVSHPSV